jgi:hypothetical protein
LSTLAPDRAYVPRDRPYTIDSDLSHLAHLTKGFRDDWRCLLRERYSVTIEGPDEATETALLVLKPHLQQPVIWEQPDHLQLPADFPGTLVIRQVEAMTTDDQRRLLAWLGRAATPIQIVSTARTPLFDLVEAGCFDAALYYRLNVALLRVGIDVGPS